MGKLKIELEDGSIIKRAVKFYQSGNFQINVIRYKNERYLAGDGDEYLRGYDKPLKIGKKLGGVR